MLARWRPARKPSRRERAEKHGSSLASSCCGVLSNRMAAGIAWDEGRLKLHSGVQRMIDIIEGGMKSSFTLREQMELYSLVYTMCTQKAPRNYSAEIYTEYEVILKDYCVLEILPVITARISQSDDSYLAELIKRWKNHKLLVRAVYDVCYYLDRYHVQRQNISSLRDVGVNKFKTLVFNPIKDSLCSTLIRIIQADRNSQLISLDTKKLVQEAIQVFVQLGDWHQLFPIRPGEESVDVGDAAIQLYTSEFEAVFLQSSAQHFSDQASRWIASESCPDYLRCIDQLKANEILICTSYLHPSSLKKLLSQIEEVCLYAHRDSIMDTPSCGLEIMLRDGLLPELSLMYNIFNGLHEASERKIIPHMVTRFKNHIRQIGSQFLDQWCASVGEKEPVDLIPQLLDLYSKYHVIVTDALQGDSLFLLAMKETFEFFTNKRIGMFSIAELLAMHCDVVLRKGGSMTDSELPIELDRIVGLFQYLSDKDEFAEHFKKQLAIRLLMQRSSSEENECSLISRLKQKCGSAYTSKLEAMLRDVELSQNISTSFCDSLEQQSKTCPVSSFNLYILTTGCWPSYSHDEFSLPPAMAEALKMFSEDFASKPQNNQKRLRWVHSLGSVSINFTAKKKKYELVVSTAQACILCLFNDCSTLTREQMRQQTGIPPGIFDDVLESCSTKWPLLVVEGENVRINEEFESTKRKISMIMQEKRAAPAERASTRAALDDDRKFAVEACIMRLMKSRKVMRHPDLVQEINAQLMKLFKPDQRVIKNRIEDLIAREYIERDAENGDMYRYLA